MLSMLEYHTLTWWWDHYSLLGSSVIIIISSEQWFGSRSLAQSPTVMMGEAEETKMCWVCVGSPAPICTCATPDFSTQAWTLTIKIWGKRRGKRQIENIVGTICLEPNSGLTREFFLIKHYFLVSSESLRNDTVQVTWVDFLDLLVTKYIEYCMRFQAREDNCLQPQPSHFIQ